jgi:DNA-directed RNA polymerase specialized sigma24 family protein
MTVPEIARTMKISEGSVKMHLSRGLLNLRKTLAPRYEKEEL